MNLILLEAQEVDSAGRVKLADGRAAHIRRVLKAEVGREVRVGIIDGPRGVAVVHAVTDTAVVLRCAWESAPPARPCADLLLALPRPKVIGRLWAQLAALGVGRIMLTNAARVERNYFDTHILAPEYYRPLLLEGLQQARDTRVPLVSIHRQFKILVEDELDQLCPDGLRLVAHPHADCSVTTTVAEAQAPRTLLAIGPEGGWNAFETALLESHGCRPVTMGERTLRTDTACVALLALVHDAMRPPGT